MTAAGLLDIYYMQCLPLRMLLKPFSWICSTLDIYCTSVRPGRGIPHMWLSLRFIRSFYPVKRVFSSFSLLLLRVKGRGCQTLLKPYETNCDKIWLMDWLTMWASTGLLKCVNGSRTTHIFPFLYLPPYSPFLNPIEELFSAWRWKVY